MSTQLDLINGFSINWVMCLEFLKVLLGWPSIVLTIAIFGFYIFRVPLSKWLENVKIDYGGATISSQQQKVEDNVQAPKLEVDQSGPSVLPVPNGSDSNLVNQWKAAAYLWEYRFLNFFLAYHSQQFLDWLCDRTEPMSLEVTNSLWLVKVPDVAERQAVVEAITRHHLAEIRDSMISITPKGREYVEFRGRFDPAFPNLVSPK